MARSDEPTVDDSIMQKITWIALAAFVLALAPFARGADTSDVRGAQQLQAGQKSSPARHAKKHHHKHHPAGKAKKNKKSPAGTAQAKPESPAEGSGNPLPAQ